MRKPTPSFSELKELGTETYDKIEIVNKNIYNTSGDEFCALLLDQGVGGEFGNALGVRSRDQYWNRFGPTGDI